MRRLLFICGSFWLAAVLTAAAGVTPLPDKVPCAVADRQDMQVPDCVHLTGWIGTRMAVNESNRLVQLDPGRLLEGYRHRPGRQTWDGEHVGKWLHAATLAWVNTGDARLREKLDFVAEELCKCQEPDGYLGTYAEANRWTEWDVWAHKYNLIGLITYMRYTGNLNPMPTCRRMADLLCRTFGDEPGQRDINTAGFHKGMAPTSVLEPMVLLHRMTGEKRYLDFCQYILRSWERPNGAKIISRLLTVKRVDKVGNAKAYEMLSCLNGALEYYRTTGDSNILAACRNAWQDIVDNRLYPTGTASYREHFHDDNDFPSVDKVGETCVTVTWLQFNAQLLRLTGEKRFADQMERTVLNQLMGAQACDGTRWGYYVEMEGRKPYRNNLDGNCCLSSGPRGIALIATFAETTDAAGVVVNLYDAGTAELYLRNGAAVKLTCATQYPDDGDIDFTVQTAEKRPFAVKLRIPPWCQKSWAQVNGHNIRETIAPDGYLSIRRKWKSADHLRLHLETGPRIVTGDHMNAGKLAVCYGPLVLAADAAASSGLEAFSIPGNDPAKLRITPEPDSVKADSWAGARTFAITYDGAPLPVHLVPFADAGQTGGRYQVWIPYGAAQ